MYTNPSSVKKTPRAGYASLLVWTPPRCRCQGTGGGVGVGGAAFDSSCCADMLDPGIECLNTSREPVLFRGPTSMSESSHVKKDVISVCVPTTRPTLVTAAHRLRLKKDAPLKTVHTEFDTFMQDSHMLLSLHFV
ncbi:hypothetical protein ACOMHN_044507 [Nucella lapillus]